MRTLMLIGAALAIAGCGGGGGSSSTKTGTSTGTSTPATAGFVAPSELKAGGPASAAHKRVTVIEPYTGQPRAGVLVNGFGIGDERTNAQGIAFIANTGRATITASDGRNAVTIFDTAATEIEIPLHDEAVQAAPQTLAVEVTGIDPATDGSVYAGFGAERPRLLGPEEALSGGDAVHGRTTLTLSLTSPGPIARRPAPSSGGLFVVAYDAQRQRVTRAGAVLVTPSTLQPIRVALAPVQGQITASFDFGQLPFAPSDLGVACVQKYPGQPAGYLRGAGRFFSTQSGTIPASATFEAAFPDPALPRLAHATLSQGTGLVVYERACATVAAPAASVTIRFPRPPEARPITPSRTPRIEWTRGTPGNLQMIECSLNDSSGYSGSWLAFVPGSWDWVTVPPAAALPAGKNAMIWTFSYETSTGDSVDAFRMSNLALPASRANTAPTSFTVP